MTVHYAIHEKILREELADVFASSGIKRPYEDLARMEKMIEQADLLVTARDNGKLIGIARALTDYCYCCYLSDLAVDKQYQHQGIGSQLISRVQKEIGEETALILLSAPSAMGYYPKAGFQKADNAFLIPRKK
ncbi:GNAT family N-acetyltransferase [Sediminibacillus dalangtanensis]|uniref:GNAT family N-acetyltransferase n=1 Tax=Sediminibacillus dalangtanensis TaxID=2729421 RepID=A0ABX7VRK7_9BACI|nr:GNAT family N-acetyltransferase [Sediminibacillus dalangtanensis]QTM98083.1 GNAT family N-acetyltransferase [Sediminibacillus dalangtanensis]